MANYEAKTTNEMKKYLLELYKSYGMKADFSQAFSVMLWGQPGIGKSELVGEFAQELGELTGKQVKVQIISLLLMMPTDLRGIPAKVTGPDGEDVARWLPPEIFKLDKSENVLNILFFDELSAAPQTVQAAAYQITNERHIGEHYLPDNALVIAAGNRVTDRSVAYKMPKALGNRLIHFEVVAAVEDWKRWAYQRDLDERIIGFVSWKPDYLNNFDPGNDDVAFATPRSWNNVNKLLKVLDFKTALPAIAGTVGLGIATEFKAFVNIHSGLPDFEKIASGELKEISPDIQSDPARMYAICSLIVSHIKVMSGSKEPLETKLENVGRYLTTFKDKEYKALVQRDTFMAVPEEFRHKLISCPSWNKIWEEAYDILFN